MYMWITRRNKEPDTFTLFNYIFNLRLTYFFAVIVVFFIIIFNVTLTVYDDDDGGEDNDNNECAEIITFFIDYIRIY